MGDRWREGLDVGIDKCVDAKEGKGGDVIIFKAI